MVIKLKNFYPCIHGLPVIHSVDTDIFDYTYFMKCMECTFCGDQCCSYGADIDMLNVNRIMNHADELEKYSGINRSLWFDDDEKSTDHEYPGNDYTRTRYVEEKDACIFLNKPGRGCMLHGFALSKGIDYHELKPFFCTLFPVTFNEGVLCLPEEIEESSLACLGDGPTLYQGARDEIKYYFGENIVAELDEIELNRKSENKKIA